MSERTLKEKTVAKRSTQDSADQKAANLQERGADLKGKLDEVDALIDEALEENGEEPAVILVEEEENVETYDGERCPCGMPLPECMWYDPATGGLEEGIGDY